MKRLLALFVTLVLLTAMLPGIASEPTTLRMGMKGEEVLRVQLRLKTLGYYVAELDGGFGPATYRAVVSFQRNNGLTVNGEVNTFVMARMLAADAVPGSPAVSYTLVLRPGDRGTEVSQAQVRLKELAYYQGTIDGVYGYGTYAAVRRFQGHNGLTVDGKIGPATRARLFHAAATPNSPEVIGTAFAILSYGSESPEVIQVQTRLKELKYYVGALDGIFRGLTRSAVVAFQRNNGLKADGLVGSATWAKLFGPGAVVATPPPPVASGLSEGATGDAVTRLQQVLTALGYYHGPINGTYTVYITQAVTAFQKKYGLPETGVMDAATTTQMNAVYTPPNPDNVAPPTAVLSLGSEGSAVTRAQARLKELSYYAGAIDGKYGSGTQKAVANFQTKSGIPSTGILDLDTAKQLYALTAVQNPDIIVVPTTDLKVGSKGEAVSQAQARLAELGYYAGAIDGSFGLSTLNAVLLFQSRNGLAIDGAIGNTTEAKLYSDTAVAAAAAPIPPTPSNILKLGSFGEEVSLVQAKLKALGYYSGAIDGKYGYSTYYAVAAFQGVVGLTKDGKVGDTTRAQLYAAGAPTMPSGTEVEPPKSTFVVLRPGDKGIRVTQMQTRLNALNYYKGAIDGVYGSGTTTAVTAFQTKNKLLVDGKVGEKTWTKLFAGDAIPN